MTKPKFLAKQRLLVILSIVFFISFLVTTSLRASFYSIDISINAWISSIQSSFFINVAKGIDFVFDTATLMVISLAIAGILFIKKHKIESIVLLGAMGGSALLVLAAKGIVQAPRPLNGLEFAFGFSYPSGHTAGVIVFSGTLAFFAWQQWKSEKAKTAISIGAVSLSSVVAFSRIYLDVHWLSDIVGSAFLAVSWLCVVFLIFRFLKNFSQVNTTK
jgi:undecaprenyl-diphosphatase